MERDGVESDDYLVVGWLGMTEAYLPAGKESKLAGMS